MSEALIIFIAGLIFTAACAIIGYVIRGLHRDVGKVEERTSDNEKALVASVAQCKQDRHGLRNEVNASLLNESAQRMSGDREVEGRLTTQIERLSDLIYTQHADTKADIRVVGDNVSKILMSKID